MIDFPVTENLGQIKTVFKKTYYGGKIIIQLMAISSDNVNVFSTAQQIDVKDKMEINKEHTSVYGYNLLLYYKLMSADVIRRGVRSINPAGNDNFFEKPCENIKGIAWKTKFLYYGIEKEHMGYVAGNVLYVQASLNNLYIGDILKNEKTD